MLGEEGVDRPRRKSPDRPLPPAPGRATRAACQRSRSSGRLHRLLPLTGGSSSSKVLPVDDVVVEPDTLGTRRGREGRAVEGASRTATAIEVARGRIWKGAGRRHTPSSVRSGGRPSCTRLEKLPWRTGLDGVRRADCPSTEEIRTSAGPRGSARARPARPVPRVGEAGDRSLGNRPRTVRLAPLPRERIRLAAADSGGSRSWTVVRDELVSGEFRVDDAWRQVRVAHDRVVEVDTTAEDGESRSARRGGAARGNECGTSGPGVTSASCTLPRRSPERRRRASAPRRSISSAVPASPSSGGCGRGRARARGSPRRS